MKLKPRERKKKNNFFESFIQNMLEAISRKKVYAKQFEQKITKERAAVTAQR